MIALDAPEIGIDQSTPFAKRGAAITGVREPRECVLGHMPGAALIPMGQLPGRTAELDRRAPVYIGRAAGDRSAAMTRILRWSGFRAYSVARGTSRWVRSGGPVFAGSATGA